MVDDDRRTWTLPNGVLMGPYYCPECVGYTGHALSFVSVDVAGELLQVELKSSCHAMKRMTMYVPARFYE